MWCSTRVWSIPSYREFANVVAKLFDLFAIETGRRLVKQQQLRLRCQSTRQFHPFPISERQIVDHPNGNLLQIHEIHELTSALSKKFLLAAATIGAASAWATKPLRVWQCPPSMTFSRTVIEAIRARFWKVRPIPSEAMR